MSTLKNPASRSSMLGQNVAVRQVGSRMVVKSRPPHKQTSTDKQIAVRKKFLGAADWARWQLDQPGKKESYQARTTPKLKSAYLVAVSDYLNSPEVTVVDSIEYTGEVGSSINVRATDDFKVIRVKVVIRDAADRIIEQGEAIQSPSHNQLWTYHATVANANMPGTKLKAIAFDNPGNEGTREIVL